MTREELEEIRKLLDDEMGNDLKERERILPPYTPESLQAIRTIQIEELLNMNKAILMELRYQNDKEE
ncbi:MAG: hypothetical protein O6830_03955 [Candidatus Dadabacteria bacterium]|nr:hypothetical protein [Candidatus Dadabacteria bacterium]